MSQMKKQTVATALAILAATGFVVANNQPASAFGFKNQDQSANAPFTSLIDQISQKFNLDKNQVNQVVDQFRQERRAQRQSQRQQQMTAGLDKAVQDGVISQSQRQAILEQFNKYMGTGQPREHMDEMHDWMESQNLDPVKLRSYIGGLGANGHHGMGMGRHMDVDD